MPDWLKCATPTLPAIRTESFGLATLSPMARLLLIDDDELLREVLAEALTSVGGHTVTQAADGRSVLAHPGIELVITDLVMPECEGLETITVLHEKRPGLPIIAISGAPTNSEIYLRMAA